MKMMKLQLVITYKSKFIKKCVYITVEANSVESRYSGVLEGWIEDTPDDDHHDEHTLELKHHVSYDDIRNFLCRYVFMICSR